MPYETKVSVGDFDGDGRSDLAAAGNWGAIFGTQYYGIKFLWGKADGTFESSTLAMDLAGSGAIATGDFNRDGKPDIFLAQQSGQQILLFPGVGSRAFGSSLSITSVGVPSEMVVADFNNDSKPDVALRLSSGLGVLLGNGDGTFRTPLLMPFSGSFIASSAMKVKDLDGDGWLDLILTGGDLQVLFNNSDGSFRPGGQLVRGASDWYAVDFGMADFNRDGRIDFVVGAPTKAGGLPGAAANNCQPWRLKSDLDPRAGGPP